jgi:sulfite reductase (NADPH) flavoprotein alpha-component
MKTLSFVPENKHHLVTNLASGLDGESLTWLSGYFAGLAHQINATADTFISTPGVTNATVPESSRLTILFGSQTGNAKRWAENLAEQARSAGVPVRLMRADTYPTKDLKEERLLLIVISTQGDGDPPDDSLGFVEFLNGRRAPKLPNLSYSVLGLGDSSYPDFCGIARTIDDRLHALGAHRLNEAALADLDIDTVALPWQAKTLALAREALEVRVSESATVTPLRPKVVHYDRSNPYQAEVILNQRLTGRGSTRDIRHIELSIEGSQLHYAAGDALGVWPTQDGTLVDQILDQLKLKPEQAVCCAGQTRLLREWLTDHRELTVLTRPFLLAHARRAENPALNTLLDPENTEGLRGWLENSQVLDVLQQFPAAWTAQDLVESLRPLVPRLYSIASSHKSVGPEVHLTLGVLDSERNGQRRWGACSHYLAQLNDGDTVRVFVEENTRFRLPHDGSQDIIMIGPGTGIAPFRSFVQEREASGASGRNWLFFGNPNFQTDFLYQTEWQQALRAGSLHRLDLAFSRDQEQKIYVQDKLLAAGADIYDWIQNGAHVYVCGDASRMAKDVHQALLTIARNHGNLTHEQAQEWIIDLAGQGRYARDVY